MNPLIAEVLVGPIDRTAANPNISWGADAINNSGTGLYGTFGQVNVAINGTQIGAWASTGLTVTGTITATGGLVLPVQVANRVLAGPTTGAAAAPTFRALVKADLPIVTLTSAAGAGGNATEAMTVTGLLTTDTILAVTQKTPGANSLAIIGYSTQATNALTGIWAADPGAGAVIVVTVSR